MKNIIQLFVVAILLITMFACKTTSNNLGNNQNNALAKLDDYYMNEDTLLNESELVIVGRVISASNIFVFSGVDFRTFEIEVISCLNTEFDSKTVTVLQTVIDEGAEVSEGEAFIPLIDGNTYILFIDYYEGPIMDKGYVINGLSFGQIDLGIIDDSAINDAVAAKRNYLQNEFADIDSCIFSVAELKAYYEKK